MKRIDQIMAHPVYQYNMKCIEEAERDRIFCKHGLSHALDVARILYIMVLEEGCPIPKELVYAAALLHDIGRYEQYEKSVPHHEAGAVIAEQILEECGFQPEERRMITGAIRAHKMEDGDGDSLKQLLYRADKMSRNCYCCRAQQDCYWEQDKRNTTIQY